MEDATIEDKKTKKRRRKKMLFLAFMSAVFLTVATYAWFSTALNVQIRFFRMSVGSDSGLTISLDGVNFSESVMVSMDSIITDLIGVYPNHTNQWAVAGLWPVSSNGIRTPNHDKFDVFRGTLQRVNTANPLPNGFVKRTLTTNLIREDRPDTLSSFIAFDIFLKNDTGSPWNDNLYFDEGTGIFFSDDMDAETIESMSGIIHSTRIGVVMINSVPLNSDVRTIQNVGCNNRCASYIFEPHSRSHSPIAIERARSHGITLVDGVYSPTFAVIASGTNLEHTNGHEGTGIPFNTTHFARQLTMQEATMMTPIYSLPNAITKARVYVWVEGQDLDSLETNSRGAAIEIVINFAKDMAGYEEPN